MSDDPRPSPEALPSEWARIKAREILRALWMRCAWIDEATMIAALEPPLARALDEAVSRGRREAGK